VLLLLLLCLQQARLGGLHLAVWHGGSIIIVLWRFSNRNRKPPVLRRNRNQHRSFLEALWQFFWNFKPSLITKVRNNNVISNLAPDSCRYPLKRPSNGLKWRRPAAYLLATMDSCHVVGTNGIDRLAAGIWELHNYSSRNHSLLRCIWLLIHCFIREMYSVCQIGLLIGLHVASKLSYASCNTLVRIMQHSQRNVGMACDAIKKPKYATHAPNRFYSCVRCVFRMRALQFLCPRP